MPDTIPSSISSSGRTCIFCGGRAGSAEHVFANWINRVFPVAVMGQPEAEIGQFERNGQERKRRWTTTGVATQTVKEVCQDCNTGWMSRLESETRPLIESMAVGRPTKLDLARQITVATWGIKTAMTAELAHGHDHNFSADDRRLVMDQGRPPAHVYVAASAINTTVGPCRFVVARGHLLDGDNMIGWYHIYTIQIGALLLQCVRSAPPIGDTEAFKFEQKVAQMEVPLFPPTVTGFAWPPQIVVEESGFVPHTMRQGSSISTDSFISAGWPNPWGK